MTTDREAAALWSALIAPMQPGRFLAEHFGTERLHLSDRPVPAFGLESLVAWQTLLQGQTARTRGHVSIVDYQTDLPPEPTKTAALAALVAAGGPLIINRIDRANPAVRDLSKAMAAALSAEVWVNAYLSPNRKDALNLHVDNHDVVVLQLIGAKAWTVDRTQLKGVVHSKLFKISSDDLKPAARGHAYDQFVLQPGDLLYLPRGTFHRATAAAAVSVHLSFGILRPSGLSYLETVFGEALKRSDLRDFVPALGGAPEDAAVRRHLDWLADCIAELARDPKMQERFLADYRRQVSGDE